MKKTRSSVEQITGVLQQVGAGVPVGDGCRQVMLLSEARELKQLRDENTKLKRLVADLSLANVKASRRRSKIMYGPPPSSRWDEKAGLLNGMHLLTSPRF